MRVLKALRATLLGVWLGGIVFTFIAAPIIFHALPNDRALAGTLVGTILKAGGFVKLGLGLLALFCDAWIFFHPEPGTERSRKRIATSACLLAALAILLVTYMLVGPKIEALRAEIADFSEATKNSPERQAFGQLHGLSVLLTLLEALLVLLALFIGLL